MLQCPYCLVRVEPKTETQGNTTFYVCQQEQCQQQLARDYVESTLPRTAIGIIGFSGHGKTVFLHSLFYVLSLMENEWPGYHSKSLDDETDEIIHTMVSRLKVEALLPDSSPANFPRPALLLHKNIPGFGNWFVSMYDTAGAVFEDVQSITEQGRYVAHAESVFFLVSLADLGDNPGDRLKFLLGKYLRAVQDHMRVDLKKRQNLVVVFTKADILRNGENALTEELDTYLRTGTYLDYSNLAKEGKARLQETSHQIEIWLKKRSCRGFLSMARENFRDVALTVVSATGAATEGQSLGAAISPQGPKRMLDPLLWALEYAQVRDKMERRWRFLSPFLKLSRAQVLRTVVLGFVIACLLGGGYRLFLELRKRHELTRQKDAEVAALVQEAEKDLKENRLISPKGQNAVEKYNAALTIRPDQAEVKNGLRQVALRYVSFAKEAMTKEEFDKAADHLDKADSVAQGMDEVKSLRDELTKVKKEEDRKKSTKTNIVNWSMGAAKFDSTIGFMNVGQNTGSIVSVNPCELGEGDRRSCFDLVIRSDNGKTIQGSFYAGVTLYDKNTIIYSSDFIKDDDSATMRGKIYSQICKSLAPGNKVEVKVAAYDSDQHTITDINITDLKNIGACLGKDLTSSIPTTAPKPSFDCSKATYASEKMICSSPDLAVLDVSLANAFKDASYKLNSDEKAIFRNQQNYWLRNIRDICDTTECLQRVYNSRIIEIQHGLRADDVGDKPTKDISQENVDLTRKHELLDKKNWDVRWVGVTKYLEAKRNDPLIILLHRNGSILEGIVHKGMKKSQVSPDSVDIRGTIESDGSFVLWSKGWLFWKGQIQEDNSIKGIFPNTGVNEDGTSKDLKYDMPIDLQASEVLAINVGRPKKEEGEKTTDNWLAFLNNFRAVVESRDLVLLGRLMSDDFSLASDADNKMQAIQMIQKHPESYKDLWKDLSKILSINKEMIPFQSSPKPWGQEIHILVDEHPCDPNVTVCSYQTHLAFRKDLVGQWHWTAMYYPGD